MSKSEYGMPFRGYDALALAGIALLMAAVLIPACSEVKDRNGIPFCKNNLMNLAKAMIVYAEENNDHLPACYTVPDTGAPTDLDASKSLGILYKVKAIDNPKIFCCPEDPLASRALTDYLMSDGPGDTHNPCQINSYGYDPRHTTKDPATVAILSDSNDPTGQQFNHGNQKHYFWNVAFLDAHVETVETPLAGYSKENGEKDDIFTDDSRALTIKCDSCIMGGVLSASAGLSAAKNEAMRHATRMRYAEFVALAVVGIVVILFVLFRKPSRAKSASAGK
jgi:hypothetical protein